MAFGTSPWIDFRSRQAKGLLQHCDSHSTFTIAPEVVRQALHVAAVCSNQFLDRISGQRTILAQYPASTQHRVTTRNNVRNPNDKRRRGVVMGVMPSHPKQSQGEHEDCGHHDNEDAGSC